MLEGKVVAVTGGGRGIGREVALLCAREGASVVVNDPGVAQDGAGTDSSPAEQTAAAIIAEGGRAAANFASIADPAGAASVVEDCFSRFGRIDAVVNTAGILRDAIWHKMSFEDWRAVIDVHLNGSFHICKAATPHFREQRSGSFVLFTSNAGLTGNVGQANYAAAKLGIVGLSQSIALDAARYGVRSNCIAPVAWTRMIASLSGDAEAPGNAKVQAMGADKIAPLAAFLASDAAAGVTNQVFGVRRNEISLYSKPRPVRVMARTDGWTCKSIAEELIPAFRSDFAKPDGVAADLFPYDPI
jgi:NAD(P)-dependent dehydrogenase (short-subunit alcohol dehydrogenase family)